MNAAATRNAPPLSPVSIGGNEPSWNSGYSPPRGVDDNKDGPYPNARGNPFSPPISGGSIGAMNGFPPGPRSNGGPSPPPSIGRSSQGTNIYARSESGRSMRVPEDSDIVLTEHYNVLKRFLGSTSQNGQPPPPNKARDKLQRLTTVQFLELSTDVYDELNRRFPPQNSEPPPKYLLPRDNFHPKRNQARQKLSSLPAPRFRDLATDVFCELERRIPRVAEGDIPRVNSPASMRMSSRSQTPVNGMNGYPPRNPSRARRPSEASSVRSTALNSAYGIPPSPGMPPPGAYDRPMAKQSQSNTIVPVKSTMVEEDDDSPLSPTSPENGDGYGMDGPTRMMNNGRSSATSEADRRQLDDYEKQVRDLQAKVDMLENDLKKKEDELEAVQDRERDSATRINVDKKSWDDARLDLENQLADAQDLNDRLKQELDRIRDDHAADTRQLREEIEDLRQKGTRGGPGGGGAGDAELQRENEELRRLLREQEQVTEEVQQEAQNLLREMRTLSQQSGAAWEKQTEMERTIEKLEAEAQEWRSRYTKTKTQLRNLKATSMSLAVDDAAKYMRERGFTTENGLVKDFHVTKFQLAVDDLLQRARSDQPDKIMETMKTVVVSVRRIIKDMDEAGNGSEEQRKLKGRIASTANNLITAAKNFAASAGISPVSLIDAAASHLVAAIVELLKTVKIRPTPAGELEEEDDDDIMTPSNNSVGFFSPRSQAPTPLTTTNPAEENLPPPPPFRGFGNRLSADSSAYSPVNSPRESTTTDRYGGGGLGINGSNGNGNANGNVNGDSGKALPPQPSNGYGANGYGGMAPQRDNAAEDLKIFVEDQTAYLVADIQELVAAIRSDAAIITLRDEISRIAESVDKIVDETSRSSGGPNAFPNLKNLQACRERLLEAGERGQELSDGGMGPPSREWRMWTQTLPPIAFEIARESKELVQSVDRLVLGGAGGGDDFS
ncbi:hypothetical protein MCOR25_005077 [Pyricularia grisea]|uniref:GIT Spa2 homology (SHD) domain-containing protein n=1 Tax=Pyricularia grisea TaxID=148305 RepID=A0A6P8BGC5_PYRGI|nr:uncharacterized protein PgNI_00289 [Pyricularia grisea]KAI6366710.1 hypothetical protein MCOR25_005077 [Pyricularia grisea]TLD15712.1 hypothetical protein PgNI_00289 [Pyricularia grisea]